MLASEKVCRAVELHAHELPHLVPGNTFISAVAGRMDTADVWSSKTTLAEHSQTRGPKVGVFFHHDDVK